MRFPPLWLVSKRFPKGTEEIVATDLRVTGEVPMRYGVVGRDGSLAHLSPIELPCPGCLTTWP